MAAEETVGHSREQVARSTAVAVEICLDDQPVDDFADN